MARTTVKEVKTAFEQCKTNDEVRELAAQFCSDCKLGDFSTYSAFGIHKVLWVKPNGVKKKFILRGLL